LEEASFMLNRWILWKTFPNDGRTSTSGGPPYFERFIERGAVKNLILLLDHKGYFQRPALSRAYFGPDALTSAMVIASGTRALTLESWHELAELDSHVIATSHGLQSLEGRTREEVRAEEKDEDYILFRRAWEEIRSALLDLTPKEDEKSVDSMEFEIRQIGVPGNSPPDAELKH
jgi:hypothetical protein